MSLFLFLCLRPLSLLHLFSFFFIYVAMAAAGSNISYPTCPTDNCGNVTIKYPFWRKDVQISTQTQYCGYEGFGINCRENRPTIELEGELYYVRNISYETGVINLVDDDVSEFQPTRCPRVRHEIEWQGLPFNLSEENVKLSFHFNCSGVLPHFASEIGCMELGTGNKSCVSYEAEAEAEAEAEDWDWACEEEVVTWVLMRGRRPVDARRLGSEYGGELRNGFQLSWGRVGGCGKCEESDGRCGYNRNTTEFMCFCSDGRTTTGDCRKGSRINWKLKLLIGVLAFIASFPLMFIISCYMKSSSSNCAVTFKPKTDDDTSVEAFIQQYGSLSTKRYTYVDIKKITNSFQAKLGQGGFGTVFKGKLSDGRLVAVKVLSSSKASGQEFINEVASIGRTSHVNIVSLLGFCFDHKKRALIYEFMPNGSLEKFISGHVPPDKSLHIGVDKLYDVAIGIARGLDYLHRGCNVRILHLDIKPHNILLDEDFFPKIADFGLAKLYSRKESIVSMLEARGTIGYIAPEVFNRNFGGVSHKSDVYSYGMMILEMVGGRKNIDASVDSGHSSEIYFPDWIYNRLKEDKFLLDSATTIEENDYARKMTVVGLWCIQANPMQRPSINDVIEMLEGSMEALKVPPKPVFSSPPRSTITIFNTSEEELGSS